MIVSKDKRREREKKDVLLILAGIFCVFPKDFTLGIPLHLQKPMNRPRSLPTDKKALRSISW
jgi:hypothetical protein